MGWGVWVSVGGRGVGVLVPVEALVGDGLGVASGPGSTALHAVKNITKMLVHFQA